jgi:hypothetical protein
MAHDGQGAAGRADGDHFDGAEDVSQDIESGVSRVRVHAVFVPPWWPARLQAWL